MNTPNPLPRRPRGRPANNGQNYADTRLLLIRRGIEVLTERGVNATTLDEILKSVGVPKGSFYHYFPSKDAFIFETLDAYAAYMRNKLDRHFRNEALRPLDRIRSFVDNACEGVERFNFARGCLVGNLGQEVSSLNLGIRQRLEEILRTWEASLSDCLQSAVDAGELPEETDCPAMAHAFWIGWEGSVLRARLMGATEPMQAFLGLFMAAIR
ncbi:TetR/AcrR family transcriptional regulator [Propionivibrio limicola]|uniref:acrylate utilization transcriptional regulator AcuR n=1 Tax=Propionivibrio limicola TaxID=167645 RepID=UPI001291904D|nr:TetR/AcrR family transcriptional regulator [Propionivibrio limicola]